jgi:hypothetical protein
MVAERFFVGDAVLNIKTRQPMLVTHVAEALSGQIAVTAQHKQLLSEELVYHVFKPEDLRKMTAEDYDALGLDF